MTKNGNDAFKRAVRKRARETGETYCQARDALLRERQAGETRGELEIGEPGVSVSLFQEPTL